jgi:hypothetical protein
LAAVAVGDGRSAAAASLAAGVGHELLVSFVVDVEIRG